ncbi:hypothetical protein ACFE04_020320 [Oxalis oulophora]
MDKDHIIVTIGIIANVFSMLSYFTSIPTFKTMIKKKAVEDFNQIPYVLTFITCEAWVVYSFITLFGWLMLLSNGIGIVIYGIYLVIFMKYAKNQRQTTLICLGVCTIVLLVVFGLIYKLSKGITYDHTIGWSCVICSIITNLYSTKTMVVDTGDLKPMSLPSTIVSMLSASLWVTFGYLDKSVPVTLANGINLLISALQMILLVVFSNSKQEQTGTVMENL